MNKGLIATIVVIALIAIMGVSGYNSLVSMSENVSGKWSQVENQLQRRNDLIPNLVSTVQGMANQEKDLIKSVTEARAKMMGAQGPAAVSAAAPHRVGGRTGRRWQSAPAGRDQPCPSGHPLSR